MIKRISMCAVMFVLLQTGMALAADYPLMNMIADEVVQKYQSATCEQLWEQKDKPKSDRQKEIIQILRDDQEMRTAFLKIVSEPILNKMFECGMIP
jgi:hypothetical protein